MVLSQINSQLYVLNFPSCQSCLGHYDVVGLKLSDSLPGLWCGLCDAWGRLGASPCMTVHLDFNLLPVCLLAVVLTTACQSASPSPVLISWTGIILPPVICSLFVISAANGAYERKRNSSFSVSGRESRQRRGDDALQTMLRCSWFPLRWYRWVFSPPALPINGNTARAYDEPQIFHSGSTYNAFKLCNIISGCL